MVSVFLRGGNSLSLFLSFFFLNSKFFKLLELSFVGEKKPPTHLFSMLFSNKYINELYHSFLMLKVSKALLYHFFSSVSFFSPQ